MACFLSKVAHIIPRGQQPAAISRACHLRGSGPSDDAPLNLLPTSCRGLCRSGALACTLSWSGAAPAQTVVLSSRCVVSGVRRRRRFQGLGRPAWGDRRMMLVRKLLPRWRVPGSRHPAGEEAVIGDGGGQAGRWTSRGRRKMMQRPGEAVVGAYIAVLRTSCPKRLTRVPRFAAPFGRPSELSPQPTPPAVQPPPRGHSHLSHCQLQPRRDTRSSACLLLHVIGPTPLCTCHQS